MVAYKKHIGKKMSYTQSFMRELEIINEKGYSTVQICKLAGISRKTLWRARKDAREITMVNADKIINALRKIPYLPFQLHKRNPRKNTGAEKQ